MKGSCQRWCQSKLSRLPQLKRSWKPTQARARRASWDHFLDSSSASAAYMPDVISASILAALTTYLRMAPPIRRRCCTSSPLSNPSVGPLHVPLFNITYPTDSHVSALVNTLTYTHAQASCQPGSPFFSCLIKSDNDETKEKFVIIFRQQQNNRWDLGR